MRGLLFYTVGTAFTSGIFLRSFFDVGYAECGLLFTIGLAFLFVWRIKTLGFDAPLFLLSLAFILTSFGVARLEYAERSVSPLAEYEGEEVVLEGVIAREPEFRENTIHLYVKPNIEKSGEYVLVTTDRFLFTEEEISYGDTILAEGTLKKPEAFATDGGRTFDYLGYLRTKNVHYTLPYADVIVKKEGAVSFISKLYDGKLLFMNAIERAIPEPAAGLGEGILLGVKRGLGENLERTFRETGIIHIVVLSGYNVMIVVEVMTYVLAFFFFPRTRMFLGIGLVGVFAILVGFSSTVVRASLMAVLLIIARSTGNVYAVLRALMLALILMLIWNPYLLVHDIGFQLSFLATLGLILFSPHIEKYLTYVPEKYGARMFLTATISTQLAVLPILLYHTGLFSVVGVVVNVLVLPMVPIAMLLTFLTGATALFSVTLGAVCGFFGYLSLMYIIRIAEFFSTLPFAAFSIDTFPFWIVIVSYVLMGVGYTHLTHKKQNDDENPYVDWIIEEEHDTDTKKPAEELRSNPTADSPFPFR